MEQWVCDGRIQIEDRGFSMLPPNLEDEGFFDLSQGSRGLLKRVDRIGTGEKPKLYAECYCSYKYFNADGDMVDSADAEEPLEVQLGAGQVTQGFDEALASMSSGESATLWLDPAFAFRENGYRSALGSVAPDTPVRLELELVQFFNPMNAQQRIQRAVTIKDEGTVKFNEKDIEVALRKYHMALRKMGSIVRFDAEDKILFSEEEQKRLRQEDSDLRSVLWTNIAACWYSKGDNEKALGFCDKALGYNPKNAKAAFRKALILDRRCEFNEAATLLSKMLEDGIGVSADIEALLLSIKRKNAEQSQTQTEVFKKMFWGSTSA